MSTRIDAWIGAKETEAIRARDEHTIKVLAEIRHQVESYRDICRSNSENARSPLKREQTRARYKSMAREFEKRTLRRDISGGHRTDAEIILEIGRQNGCRSRSGAYNAIQQGLRILSDERRKPDGLNEKVIS
jgi:hypothetical protein